MTMVKRMIFLLGLFALGNMIALAGGVGYLVSQGKLDLERARAIVEVIKGPEADEEPAATTAAGDAEKSVARRPASNEDHEIARLNLERVMREADDRLRYASLLMLDIERKREDFERLKAEHAQAREAEAQEQLDSTFQKDVEVLSLLKPKIALDNLLVRPVDEAARLMMALDSRTSKKIIEAASKEPRKWTAMLEIQRQMRSTPDVDGDAGASEQARTST